MNEYLPPISLGISNDLYPTSLTSERRGPLSLSVVTIIRLTNSSPYFLFNKSFKTL